MPVKTEHSQLGTQKENPRVTVVAETATAELGSEDLFKPVARLWESSCAAVQKLRGAGFFCIRGPFDFERPELLWSVLTSCYSAEIFGSQRIAAWLDGDGRWKPFLCGDRITARDVRRFRRNNRKNLTLAIEEVIATQPLPTERIHEEAERLLMEAIQFDVGEFDD